MVTALVRRQEMYTRTQQSLALMVVALALPGLALADRGRSDWAEVVDVEPVVEVVRIPTEQHVCRDQQVQRAVPERRSATPMILGALIGGVVGNQFGGGSGKTAMTVAGAALGTSVAADQQNKHYPKRYYTVTEQHCVVETHWQEQERINAWDVTYKYHGRLYRTRTLEHPGEHIRVQVDVRPAG